MEFTHSCYVTSNNENLIKKLEEIGYTYACISRINYYFGYTKDNVQFISNSIKNIKDHVDHEEMVKLCEDIRDFWNNKN